MGTLHLDSPIEQQVSDLDEFGSSCRFFNSSDTKFVPIDYITPINFIFPLEVDLIDYKSLGLGTIESSSASSVSTMPFREESKNKTISTKVTCIRPFLLNMILILLFLGDNILSWIQNCLLASPFCSSCSHIFLHHACAYEPDAGFHAFN